MSDSTANSLSRVAALKSKQKYNRPKKPYPEFPLYPHPLGYWSKKVAGVIRNYGRWGHVRDGKLVHLPYEQGWQQALTLYKAQASDHALKRESPVKMVNGEIVEQTEGFTVKDLLDRFRTAKFRKLENGRLAQRSYDEYVQTCDRIARVIGVRRSVEGLRPDDFNDLLADISKTWGLIRIGNEITRVKSVFKYGRENGWITKPVPFGSEFKKPEKKELRKHKKSGGGNMMEADEIHKVLAVLAGEAEGAKVKPNAAIRAMVMLGVNCGFGPTDFATLPRECVDLGNGWIDFPRPKTGIDRRCPLWPETVATMREAVAQRPDPAQAGAEKLMFLTSRGRQFISGHAAHPVTVAAVNAMEAAGVHKKGRGPYTFRHVFRTIADRSTDRAAIDVIMGHADHSMASHYRERIDDDRLVAVSNTVREWLFGAHPGKVAPQPELATNAAPSAPETPTGTERPQLKLFAG